MAVSTLPSIGEVVRLWRRHYGWSAVELARRAGLTKAYLSEVEHDRITAPRPEKVRRLADGLGLSERDLLLRRLPPDSADSSPQLPDATVGPTFGRRNYPNPDAWAQLATVSSQADEQTPIWADIRATVDRLAATSDSSLLPVAVFLQAGLRAVEAQLGGR